MKHYLFAGQDILIPALSSGEGGENAAEPAVELPPDVAEALAATAIGRRDYEQGGTRYAAMMLGDEGAELALGIDSGAASARAPAQAPARSLRRISLREALAEFSAEAMRPALRGIALLRWLEAALFCGACGSPLSDEKDGDEEPGSRTCPACGRIHFSRISPAVIVLIRKGKRALLAHNARFRPGHFGLIAGFVEAGESLEEAAAREVREEAGVEIRNLRYIKSQPWPFPDSLMVAFTAEWESGEEKPDGVEIAELRWCLPSELPEIPPKGSVARYLIDEFSKEG